MEDAKLYLGGCVSTNLGGVPVSIRGCVNTARLCKFMILKEYFALDFSVGDLIEMQGPEG